MFVFSTNTLIDLQYIINFPTKQHWCEHSKSSYIKDGLKDSLMVLDEHKITSIAIPPLGCGNEGIGWNVVREMIISTLLQYTSVKVELYSPTGVHDFLPLKIRQN